MGQAPIIRGLEAVQAGLAQSCERMKQNAEQGLIAAARMIQQDMESTPPLTPVKTGNLRSSFFIVTKKGNVAGRPKQFTDDKAGVMNQDRMDVKAEAQARAGDTNTVRVSIGYSANYAAYVHEMMEGVEWTRPNSGPKWFSAALNRNRTKIRQMVAMYVRVKRRLTSDLGGGE